MGCHENALINVHQKRLCRNDDHYAWIYPARAILRARSLVLFLEILGSNLTGVRPALSFHSHAKKKNAP